MLAMLLSVLALDELTITGTFTTFLGAGRDGIHHVRCPHRKNNAHMFVVGTAFITSVVRTERTMHTCLW